MKTAGDAVLGRWEGSSSGQLLRQFPLWSLLLALRDRPRLTAAGTINLGGYDGGVSIHFQNFENLWTAPGT
jgi:hypothetical protein